MTPTYTQGEALAAMCIWEDLLEKDRPHTNGHMAYHEYRDQNGAAETRDRVLAMGRQVEAAWIYASNQFAYDRAFDWEFVPAYVELCIDEQFSPRYASAEAVVRALKAAGKI